MIYMRDILMRVDNMETNLKVYCEAVIEVRNEETGEIETYRQRNLVTDYGLTKILQSVTGIDTTIISRCAIGTGSTPTDWSDVLLDNQDGSRKQRVETEMVTSFGGGAAGKKVWIKTFFNRTEHNVVWREMGMFTTGIGADCCSRIVLTTPINKTSDYTITVTWSYIIVSS